MATPLEPPNRLDATLPACPTDGELVALLEGRLPEPAARRLEDHIAACSVCRAVLDGLAEGDTAPEHALAGALGATLGRRSSIGRYRVLSLIGRGGMGDIYAAYDPELDRRVALKLLRTASSSESSRKRLVREARALGKLSHPNVVQVYDAGEHDGDVFVAMELVEGQAFDAWCSSVPRPGWHEVLAAYLDVARGLEAAHASGLIHRDVKPSNILRGADGRVRVVDFGLAAASEGRALAAGEAVVASIAAAAPASPEGSREEERLTTTGALLGTPLYMAPEQFEGPRASAACDQYGLCTALYEGLYGVLPFVTRPGGGAVLTEILAPKKGGAPPAHRRTRRCRPGSTRRSRAASLPGPKTGTPRSRR